MFYWSIHVFGKEVAYIQQQQVFANKASQQAVTRKETLTQSQATFGPTPTCVEVLQNSSESGRIHLRVKKKKKN